MATKEKEIFMKYLVILLICSSITFPSEQETSSSTDPHSVVETNPEVQESEVQESEVQESEVQEAEVQEAEVQEAEVQEAEVQEAEVQEAEVQEAEAETTSSASLRITTNTDSVIVLVNRSREGMTPLLLEDITPGTYNIMLLKQGYDRIQDSIDISAGENRLFTAELEKTAPQQNPADKEAEDTSSAEVQEEIQEGKDERRIFEIVATSVFAAMVILITAFELSDS
jgi:hypothetical protein